MFSDTIKPAPTRHGHTPPGGPAVRQLPSQDNLCIYYRLCPSESSPVDFSAALRSAMPPQDYIMDAVNLFKNKNVSPDSVYMIFNSLFRPDPCEGIK
jgi:hypothetical protein